jgi:hypothetical protein
MHTLQMRLQELRLCECGRKRLHYITPLAPLTELRVLLITESEGVSMDEISELKQLCPGMMVKK